MMTLALSVLDCGLHLKKAIYSTSFDFSTVKAVSQWLVEALENCPSLFIGLHDRANLLRNLVSPSTGLGLSDLWSTLYIEQLPEKVHESVKRTESLSFSLKNSPTSSGNSFILSLLSRLPFPFIGLRWQAFNAMCLEMLPTSLVSQDTSSLSGLKTALDSVGEFKVEAVACFISS
jgi:midasin